ncbi:hypothetical protein MPSI1_001005 [Malassezia psittaci]|uniref:Uncharacterized protein n=1 Tax=Malassezia psittaci TaxID=1821823 RepID=A0AAF0F460_9BASI|nr:hypothetical protein MPSI1_001005 [Malassezia psittaci]
MFSVHSVCCSGAQREPATLLLDLLRTSKEIEADRVWTLYLEALHDRPEELSGGSVRIPRTLRSAEHRQVLHALVPHTQAYAAYLAKRARLRTLREQAQNDVIHTQYPSDLSSPQESAPRPPDVPMQDSEARVYLSRVQALLSNMRAESSGVCLADYHAALHVLAYGGHWPEMKILLEELMSMRGNEQELTPSLETYDILFRGLFEYAKRETRRLQQAYGYALNPTQHSKHLARTSAQDGEAKKVVQSAAKQTARDVTTLIQDMQMLCIQPKARTLEYAARVLRLTGQLPALLTLIRTGFGVDIANPDADRGETEETCAPTTQTLNTVLMALGEHATVSNMVSAYEAMTRVMPGHANVTGTDSMRRECTGNVQPNAKSFSVLLKHACTAPDTLFFSAAILPTRRPLLARFTSQDPVGFVTQKDLDLEIHRRLRGDYFSIARYLLDDCLDRYKSQVALLCEKLNVDAPALDLDASSAHKMLKQAAKNWRKHQASKNLLPYFKHAATAGRPSIEERSVFLPPSVGITLEMVYPMISLASRRRSSAHLGYLQKQLSLAYLLKCIEANAVEHAAKLNADATSLAASLHAHYERLLPSLEALQWLLLDRIPKRIQTIREVRREHAKRRASNAATREQERPRRRSARRHRVERQGESLPEPSVIA